MGNLVKKSGHGPSSYWMHDPEFVFGELGLNPGDSFLDAGCGAGDYSLHASKIVGESGRVIAVDHWEPTVNSMADLARAQNLTNIETLLSDIRRSLPIEDNSVDMCLLSTVLHIFNLSKYGAGIYSEVSRVLKPGGCLAVIECKKEDMAFGPPVHMRLSPEDIEDSLKGTDFKKTGLTDLGYNYLIKFDLKV